MDTEKRNRAFILGYYNALAGKRKTEELIRRYVSDEKLIGHIKFFEQTFPGYDAVVEEMYTAGDKVFVRASMSGRHEGSLDDIPPTFKHFKMPFAICYRIKDNKIIDHWMIADQMELLEQLGLAGTIKPEFEKVEKKD
ncbi:MAG: ester cyclase [Phaeodactylibacter sp.]|nr:ester cyclase [Phaeodactylibacter sp.]MCB9296216.1 ester cyclase [Lewinellaceae bacterium]